MTINFVYKKGINKEYFLHLLSTYPLIGQKVITEDTNIYFFQA